LTQKCKIFIKTQGDPTNHLVQTTPSTLFIEKTCINVLFSFEMHISDPKRAYFSNFGLVQLKIVQNNLLFKIVAFANFFFWCISYPKGAQTIIDELLKQKIVALNHFFSAFFLSMPENDDILSQLISIIHLKFLPLYFWEKHQKLRNTVQSAAFCSLSYKVSIKLK
jgi:hypothetical protein